MAGRMRVIAAAVAMAGAVQASAAATPLDARSAAAIFGAREDVQQVSLSPDGTKVAFIVPGSGASTILMVAPTDGAAKPIARADGKPAWLRRCGWSADTRLVCTEYGIDQVGPLLASFTRMMALDPDGSHMLSLTRRANGDVLRISQYDCGIIDWMAGTDGTLLMERDVVPEQSTGTHLAQTGDGLGVERVNTRNGRAQLIEKPHKDAAGFISDGRGTVRIMALNQVRDDYGTLSGVVRYLFRSADDKVGWRALCQDDAGHHGIQPIAVDPNSDVAYVLKTLDGRRALYRLSLDGKGTLALAYANDKVDVDDVIQVGRAARVIGATFVTERREMAFFDPAYATLAKSLSKAIPHLPLISFLGASADENVLLLRAGSDVDPGHYYTLDRARKQMHEILAERAALTPELLSPVKAVSYRADDGTLVPAYLTLPRGGGTQLPAIVLPHGGPAARDEWGFDWLAQFYAARGFAVLQLEFRGSAGFGDGWFVENGFRSWKTAIGDVAAAGRWLVREKIADPAKLAILGWSYGGYAALQAAATEPQLFHAVVAIAPVTDLAMLKAESAGYTSSALVNNFVGAGPHVRDGSPLQHPDAIAAPVLMFHGDRDINVNIAESRAMQGALQRAGRKSELVVYPGLDHQLRDSSARTDMLARSDAFLRAALGL